MEGIIELELKCCGSMLAPKAGRQCGRGMPLQYGHAICAAGQVGTRVLGAAVLRLLATGKPCLQDTAPGATDRRAYRAPAQLCVSLQPLWHGRMPDGFQSARRLQVLWQEAAAGSPSHEW